jgi:hypothetical protein
MPTGGFAARLLSKEDQEMVYSRRSWRIQFVVMVGLLAVLTACNYRQGRVEVTYSDRMRATYALFDGQSGMAVDLAAGEMMTLAYDLEIITGSLSMQIVDPDRTVVWEDSFNESSTGSASVTAVIEGSYRLVVKGDSTKGGFDLHWEIADKD